jgi:hypothetical protein
VYSHCSPATKPYSAKTSLPAELAVCEAICDGCAGLNEDLPLQLHPANESGTRPWARVEIAAKDKSKAAREREM